MVAFNTAKTAVTIISRRRELAGRVERFTATATEKGRPITDGVLLP